MLAVAQRCSTPVVTIILLCSLPCGARPLQGSKTLSLSMTRISYGSESQEHRDADQPSYQDYSESSYWTYALGGGGGIPAHQ